MACFHGAKLLLIKGGRLLTYLRDHLPHIPFPAHWDLPGGGREGDETPVECAIRELHEEFGITLTPARLLGHWFSPCQRDGEGSWLFVGELTGAEISGIRFGDEGQDWQMMEIADLLAHPLAVPHFRQRVEAIMFPNSSGAHRNM